MKKLITTCVLLTALTMVSFAQSKGTSKTAAAPGTPSTARVSASAEQIAERNVKALQQQLGLTADQYTGCYAAELDYQKQVKQARDGGYEMGPGQSMQAKMGRDQRYKSVMTADQYTKYESGVKH